MGQKRHTNLKDPKTFLKRWYAEQKTTDNANWTFYIGLLLLFSMPPHLFDGKFYPLLHFNFPLGGEGIPWNSRTQALAKQMYDSSNEVFKISTSIAAGIWAALVLGHDKVKWLTRISSARRTLWCACTLLLFSFYQHLRYTRMLTEIQVRAEVITLENPAGIFANTALASPTDPMFNAIFVGQKLSLIFAVTLIGLTVANTIKDASRLTGVEE
ncbi:hypothetical protein [Crateriforma spongiae]|uniref:hypothetical protein n=1 Tax=Crateriforma spongiae TaxID=2724528 RepID=UPI001444D8EA|nr:hypothetical protein [Crateriforma spongiae]